VSKLVEIRWHARADRAPKRHLPCLRKPPSVPGNTFRISGIRPGAYGAPMLAFNRIGDEPIRIHSNVENPDIVMVLDPSLIGPVNVAEGLKDGGVIVVNTQDEPQAVRQKLGVSGNFKVATVDASGIAVETIGRDIPNTPMIGALLKVYEFLPFESFMERMRIDLDRKFHGRKAIVEGNLNAMRRAYQEVKQA